MPFLRRRRRSSSGVARSSRRKRMPTLRDQMDWSLNPDTAREVLGILFTVLGVLFIISIFHFAGRFGDVVIQASTSLFGLLGYVAPLVLLVIGIKLLVPRQPDEHIKASVVIGLSFSFYL